MLINSQENLKHLFLILKLITLNYRHTSRRWNWLVREGTNDLIQDIKICIKWLCFNCTLPSHIETQRLTAHKLANLEKSITTVKNAIEALPPEHDDFSLIKQYKSQLFDYKVELSSIHTQLWPVEDEELILDQPVAHDDIELPLFECFHRVRRVVKIIHEQSMSVINRTTKSTDNKRGSGYFDSSFYGSSL